MYAQLDAPFGSRASHIAVKAVAMWDEGALADLDTHALFDGKVCGVSRQTVLRKAREPEPESPASSLPSSSREEEQCQLVVELAQFQVLQLVCLRPVAVPRAHW